MDSHNPQILKQLKRNSQGYYEGKALEQFSFKVTNLVTCVCRKVSEIRRTMKIYLVKRLIWCFAILTLLTINSFAQSSSTDTLEKGTTYYEANLWTGTQSHQNGGTQIYGGRFAYGLTNKVEIGLGGSFSNPHDAVYPPEIQPSVKWKFYENEKYGVKASGGVLGFIPFAKRTGTDTFAMVYANVSKDVEKMKGAKFTVGGYALAGGDKSFGTRKGWNFVYDQPLTNKVNFSTQWVTGKNRFGYLTPGFSITTSKNSSLFLGYSIGNYDYDNHGPYISYSITH